MMMHGRNDQIQIQSTKRLSKKNRNNSAEKETSKRERQTHLTHETAPIKLCAQVVACEQSRAGFVLLINPRPGLQLRGFEPKVSVAEAAGPRL